MRRDSILIATLLAVGSAAWVPSPGAAQAQPPEACESVSPDASSGDRAPTSEAPAILDHLAGAWEGEGTLFGRPSTFIMTWAPELGGRFLGLSYEIHGEFRMSARAHYRIADGPTLRGVWLDSRGEILQLEATATDSDLTTVWRSDTERGRTVYRRTGGDSLEVCDYVQAGDGWRLFGTAHHTRR
jgi:hypothetical protein